MFVKESLQSLQIVKYTVKPVATQAIHRGARVLNKTEFTFAQTGQ